MSMRIQEALSNCCQGIGAFLSRAGESIGTTVSTVTAYTADYAQKAAEYVQPHFENLKTFVSENRGPILLVTAAAAIGAIAYAVINSIFCRGTNTTRQVTPPAPDSLDAFVTVVSNAASTPAQIHEAFFIKLNEADREAIKRAMWVNSNLGDAAGDDWAGNQIRSAPRSPEFHRAIEQVIAQRQAQAATAATAPAAAATTP